MIKRISLILLIIAPFATCKAQISRLGTDVEYAGEIHATMSDDQAPFWFVNNRYGLSSIEDDFGYVRGSIRRSLNADSLRRWAVGYGIDLVIPHHFTSDFVLQQLYVETQYKYFRLTVGAKELPMEFSNPELSTGDMTMSTNARPIPQLRLEMPDYWDIPGTDGWVGVKAHAAFGWFTDCNWLKSFTGNVPSHRYTSNARYHSKSLYFRIGNEKKLPLIFEGGLRIDCQFGGDAWNLNQRKDDTTFVDLSHVNLNNGLKTYWNALTFGGNDPNDGDFKNTEGNHVGSWHGSLNYQGKGWSVRGYLEHQFDDHSQLFWQYGWKDMKWGIEAQLPKNPFVSTMLVELISTKDQTSAVYHDATEAVPIQISGRDNYYSHQVYGAWQHWGMTMGNPLLISPLYNENHQITPYHNRITATHLGIAGDPCPALHYRVLYTHMRSWGTYGDPLIDTRYNNFMLAEMTVKPHRLKGWSFTGAFGMNRGDLLKKSSGGSLSIRKEGILNRKCKNEKMKK
jgi:hypothetical protein